MQNIEQLAQPLIDAYATRNRVRLRPENGPINAEQAYAVQAAVWRDQVGMERPRVWKVGAKSKISLPVAAPVFPSRVSTSPGVLCRHNAGVRGVEAEIAIRFARGLDRQATPHDRETILAMIGSLHVAMEIVESRLLEPELSGENWCLADNLLNSAFILGDEIMEWRNQALKNLHVSIFADGKLLDERVANPPLDDLLHCLPWWINHIGGVQAGDVVTTGAWTGMHRIGEGHEIRVEFAGVGQCRATVEEAPCMIVAC